MVIDDFKTCMIRYQPDQIVEITILKVNHQTIHELASVLATGHQRWLIDWRARDYDALNPIALPPSLQQVAATLSDFRMACLLRRTLSEMLGRESLRAKWYNTSRPGNHRTAAREWLLENAASGDARPFSYQYFG